MFSTQFGKCYKSTKKQSHGGADIRKGFPRERDSSLGRGESKVKC